jgi:hypothetical protein|tara:strand:+ start:1131 stop:1313 length:183 start_codon:yes stop_codon:yes gene_type:complete
VRPFFIDCTAMNYATNFERDLARLVQITGRLLEVAEKQLEATERMAAKPRRQRKDGGTPT